jgi:hypothetical protein
VDACLLGRLDELLLAHTLRGDPLLFQGGDEGLRGCGTKL